MSWTVEETQPEDNAWGEFIAKQPHLLFHEPIWAPVLRDGVSKRVACMIIRRDGTVVCGAMGVVVGGLGCRIGYFSYPYGGIVGESPSEQELRSLLLDFGKRIRVCQMQFVGYPGETPAEVDGAQIQHDETNILPLEGLTPETLMQGYRLRRRQEIKKAIKRGITVATEHDASAVGLLHEFYLDTMRRTGGIARYKKELIGAIVEHLGPLGRARLTVARLDEEPLGAMLIVDSRDVSHGLMLVSSDEGRKVEVNKLLLHTAVEDAVRAGQQRFDFMPSGNSAPGVAQFKRLWQTECIALTHRTLIVDPPRAWLWRRALQLAGRQPFRTILSVLRSRS